MTKIINSNDLDFCIICTDGKYGVIDCHAEIIIPTIYSSIVKKYGFLLVELNGKYQVLGTTSKTLSDIFDEISDLTINYTYNSHSQLILTRQGNNYGLINLDGEIIVPCIYDNIAVIAQEYPNKYYNRYHIELRIKDQVEKIFPLRQSQGECFLHYKGDKWGACFSFGRNCIPTIYDELYDIEGGDIAYNMDGCLTGGSVSLYRCTKNLACVLDDKVGIISRSGTQIVPCIYDEIRFCSMTPGYYVIKNGKWGYWNDGREVINCEYDFILNFQRKEKGRSHTWLTLVNKGDRWYRWHNNSLSDWYYHWCGDLIDNRSCVSNDNGYGFINENLEEIIPCQYIQASDFKNGTAYVRDMLKGQYIDIFGNKIIVEKSHDLLEDRYEELRMSKRIDI